MASKNKRLTPIHIEKEEFKNIGYKLVDEIGEFLHSIDKKPVTTGASANVIQQLLGTSDLVEHGKSAEEIVSKSSELLINHSLFNGHPKFMGYITASPAPIGMLADFLAAAINPNVGAHILSPVASEIERQTIHWLTQLIGVPTSFGGILVSGGNMANFTAFLAARTAKLPKTIKEEGLTNRSKKWTVYCSKTTHTWIEKATILFGHGLNSIRWIDTDISNKMDMDLLELTIQNDKKSGHHPFMVIGTAGDVSTGSVDDLSAIATICKNHNLWFHIDGAYGAPAAAVEEFKALFSGMDKADSIALDPHKWLYAPLEAGCTLVRNPKHLTDTFSSNPDYYNFSKDSDNSTQNFYEFGLQNSRGFRALKVWMALQHVGRSGYEKMIREDIELAQLLFELASNHPKLEAISQNLSITTLRYIPLNAKENDESYLNTLNETICNNLQKNGAAFLSNAIVNKRYCLRGCIVNFRTSRSDIEEIIAIIVKEGDKTNKFLRKQNN